VSLDGLRAPTALWHSADQHLTIWLPLVRLYSGALEIALILLLSHSLLCTPEHPWQHRLYVSFVLITVGILLPTVHPLGHSQALTLSILDMHPSFCRITSVHHQVL
jgi:hypothetical protein